MVEKIRLLGMVLDNFSVHEEVLLAESFYEKSGLNIIRTVSMEMLVMAADSSFVRDGIAQADLLIMADEEILKEAGISSGRRLKEAAGRDFMWEYLKSMSQRQRRVFLVAQDDRELELLREYLDTMVSVHEKLQIVGYYRMEDCDGEYDVMINEINAATPDVLLSVLDSPREDEFLLKSKAKIGAKVWYSLGTQYSGAKEGALFLPRFKQFLHKERFKNIVRCYEQPIDRS